MFEYHDDFAPSDADFEAELTALENSQSLAAPMVPSPNPGFEMPRAIWTAMLGCYAVFFAAITIATGGSARALFVIAVSAIYTVIYFGVARIGAKQAGREDTSPLDQGKPLQTWTGPMDRHSVFGQVLIVPLAIAIFSSAIAFVILMVS